MKKAICKTVAIEGICPYCHEPLTFENGSFIIPLSEIREEKLECWRCGKISGIPRRYYKG